MTKGFHICKARANETDEGWVWLTTILPSRTVIRVERTGMRRHVYCQLRQLDKDYISDYERKISTMPTGDWNNRIVMNQWYRDALVIGDMTSERREALTMLTICPDLTQTLPGWYPLVGWWCSIRATCQHPNIVVRVGTRLGILGAWLGFISLLPITFNMVGVSNHCAAFGPLFLILATASGILAVKAGWGVGAPASTRESV